MLKLGRLYYTSREVDLLASLGTCNSSCTWYTIMKQLVFLIISSTPFLKNIAQISSHYFWLNLIVIIFHTIEFSII